mgnify:CR=1 FL=1
MTERSTREGRRALLFVAGLLCAVVAAVTAGCGDRGGEAPAPGELAGTADSSDPGASPGPTIWVDAAGDTLELDASPERIVALVPSVTRVISELGEAARLVGRTRYDTATALAELPSVGAGMGPDYEALLALRADLVVYFVGASDPETPAQLERLGLRRFGVRPDNLDDVVGLYGTFGGMLGQPERGEALVASLEATLDSVARAVASSDASLGVAYLIDGDPPWAAGPATYIGQLVELAGGTLLPTDLPPLYAPISPESLVRAEIDVILLSGGSDIDARLAEGRRIERVPNWVEVPGPEVRDAAWVIAEALHPALSRAPSPRSSPGGAP